MTDLDVFARRQAAARLAVRRWLRFLAISGASGPALVVLSVFLMVANRMVYRSAAVAWACGAAVALHFWLRALARWRIRVITERRFLELWEGIDVYGHEKTAEAMREKPERKLDE